MTMSLENEIGHIITREVESLNRPDLYRKPIISYSSADDDRYSELKQIIGSWHMTPVELLRDVQSVISYFVPFSCAVTLDPGSKKEVSPLWAEAYMVINEYFNHINEVVSAFLIDRGFSAKTIQATHTYDPKDMKSAWSHRSAAAIAGMGAFGINRLLITAKGSGGRFCSILTSAPLIANSIPFHNDCLYYKNSTCGICIKACPVNALSVDEIDRFTCQAELVKNSKLLEHIADPSKVDVCGKCLSICPKAYIE